MNKNYRMVWSEARQAFVVAHENASSRGKSSTTRKTVVARSLAAAALALGATQVQAQTTTVTGSTVSANTFNLATGQSLLNKGTIANFDAFAAVAATGGVVAGGITNNGTIAADPSLGPCCDGNQFVGVLVSKASLAQGITNTGTIYGSGTGNMSAGINIAAGTVAGGITNSGRIYSTNIFGGGIYIQSGSTLTGGIHNSGVISGASGISVQSSSISGGITNAAGGTLVGYISGRNTSAGISLWGSTVTGGIHNSGVISGSSGISIYGYPGPPSSLDTLVNNAGGSIRGTAYAGLGIHSNSQISGAVVNAGTISGRGVWHPAWHSGHPWRHQ